MSRSLAIALCVLTLWLSSTGCVSKSSKISDKDKAKVEKYVVDSVPEGIEQLGINFDDKITLVGYKLNPSGPLKSGEKVQLTLYWRVDKELGEKGWGLFTHLHDSAGKRVANIDNVGPLREWRKTQQVLPPSDWKAGKVYVDEQSFSAPKKNTTNELQITTGIWKGDKRLPIKAGPKLSEDRALVAKVPFTPRKGGSKKRSTKVPTLRVDRLDATVQIKIDGKLDEPAWKDAAKAGPFVNVRTGDDDKGSPVQGSARLLWNDKNLFVGFDVSDSSVIGGFDPASKDPQLWTKDTVEVMIDPDGDGDNKDYYEIQVNPQNLVFDSQFDDYNLPKKEPNGPFGHQEWSAKLESAVVIDGTLDKADDKDKGYTVEIRIPWASLNKAKKVPPEVGSEWRMNLYAMQDNSGVAWSPILGQGNFHKASRFGKVLWAEQGWKPAESEKKPDEPGAKKANLDDAKGKLSGKDVPVRPALPAPASSSKPNPAVPSPANPAPAKPPTP